MDETHRKHRHGETHGLREDIDEETPIQDVKAPNVFQRAKEEIEAIVQAIHPKKEDVVHSHESVSDAPTRDSGKEVDTKQQNSDSPPEKYSSSLNKLDLLKQDKEAKMDNDKLAHHHHHHHHHKETHGRSDDIDENTPIVEVKGPNIFERAKEEFEAVVEAIHPKKDPGNVKSSPKKEGGLGASIGRKLEKICLPGSHNKD